MSDTHTWTHVLKALGLLLVYGVLILLGLGMEHLEQLAREL